MTLGDLTLTLRDGVAHGVVDSSGARIGFTFVGSGGYSLRSTDPVDRDMLPRNLPRTGALHPNADGSLADSVRAVVVLASAPWAGSAPGDGAPPAPAATEARDAFDKLCQRIDARILHRIAAVRANGLPDTGYAWAEIDAAAQDVSFELDRQETYFEELSAVDRREGLWIRRGISRQRLDDPANPVPSALTLRDARFDISTDDNRSAAIDSELALEVARDGTRVAGFELMSHRDERGPMIADGDHALEVVEVTDGSGAAVPFVHARHELLVDLVAPRTKGDRLTLRVRTRGDVLSGMSNHRDDNYVALLFDPWYPRPLGTGAAGFTFSFRIRTRDPFVPIASGKRVDLRREGESWILETRQDAPALYPCVFAGKYHTYEATFDGLVVRVHSYAMERSGLPERMAALASGFVRYYEELFGPYPFFELHIVEVPEYGYGIAPPGMVLLTTEAYKPYGSSLAAYLSRGINSRLAHEIAHHWFGHKTMITHPRDAWLNESFAEYASGLAMGALDLKGGRKVMGFREMVVAWRNGAEAVEDAGSILGATQVSGDLAYEHYFRLLYERGPTLLHMLRSTVGDRQFEAMVRRFLDDANRSAVTTDDFRRAVKDVRGVDMGWFFDQWIARTGIPTIAYQYQVQTAPGGAAVVQGSFEQPPAQFAKIVIPVVVEMRGGERIVKVVVQDQPTTPFRFEVPATPTQVEIDPARNNLARYQRR